MRKSNNRKTATAATTASEEAIVIIINDLTLFSIMKNYGMLLENGMYGLRMKWMVNVSNDQLIICMFKIFEWIINTESSIKSFILESNNKTYKREILQHLKKRLFNFFHIHIYQILYTKLSRWNSFGFFFNFSIQFAIIVSDLF